MSPEGNTNVQLSAEALKQARSAVGAGAGGAAAGLSAAFIAQNLTRNLAALGIQVHARRFRASSFPTFVGPFTTMDARVTGTQSVFDFSSIRRFQASKVGVRGGQVGRQRTVEEQVAAQVARAYLAAVRADADVEAAQANVALSRGGVEAGGEPEGRGHRHRHRDHAREGAAGERPAAAAGGARTRARAAALQLLRAIGLRLDTRAGS